MKNLYMEPDWSFQEFLKAGSQRLDIVPLATRVFTIDGVEIDDCLMIEDDDILFLSTNGEDFIMPSNANNQNIESNNDSLKDESAIVHGYRVSTVLGRGGFGEVRLGEHTVTSEKVALKFLRKSDISTIGAAERTVTEIQCLATLKHPNIIKLLHHTETLNHVILIFELMEGRDLMKYLCKRGDTALEVALTEDECRPLFHQIISGVSYAHNHHICHRDLKLENILYAL
jgi:serine/threonine protein kinase